jgi:hypothetical protein
MSDIVLIPFPGLGTLAMSRVEFDAALVVGRELGTSAPAKAHAPAPWRCGRVGKVTSGAEWAQFGHSVHRGGSGGLAALR